MATPGRAPAIATPAYDMVVFTASTAFCNEAGFVGVVKRTKSMRNDTVGMARSVVPGLCTKHPLVRLNQISMWSTSFDEALRSRDGSSFRMTTLASAAVPGIGTGTSSAPPSLVSPPVAGGTAMSEKLRHVRPRREEDGEKSSMTVISPRNSCGASAVESPVVVALDESLVSPPPPPNSPEDTLSPRGAPQRSFHARNRTGCNRHRRVSTLRSDENDWSGGSLPPAVTLSGCSGNTENKFREESSTFTFPISTRRSELAAHN